MARGMHEEKKKKMGAARLDSVVKQRATEGERESFAAAVVADGGGGVHVFKVVEFKGNVVVSSAFTRQGKQRGR